MSASDITDLTKQVAELSDIVSDLIEELDINADTLGLSAHFLLELGGRTRDVQSALRARLNDME